MKTQKLWLSLCALAIMPATGFGQCALSTVSETGSGATMVYTCPGDGNADLIQFDNMTTGTANYGYLVTDPMGVILGIPAANAQDFEGAPAGICRVYGISYSGPLTANLGDNIYLVDLAQQGCCILSSNWIEVVRDMPEGGNVLTAAGENTVYTCPGDGNADVVAFAVSNNSNSMSQYVVTDANGIILGLPPGNMQDFEGAPAGTCLMWHLSYTGNLTAMAGDDVATVVFSDDCYDLSDDYVMIVRDMPEGGNVLTAAGESMVYTCPGDGNADVIEFAVSNNSNSMSQYVVTDANGIILGLPPGNMQDFEGAPAGTCLMWHLSYTGTLSAMAGDDVATVVFSDDCYDLSDDYVMIIREMPEGGNVLTAAGESMVYTCPGDGNADVIEFAVSNNSNSMSQYVVTDANGIILGLPPGNMQDFEGAPAGTCLMWHLSYTGNLMAMAGDDVAMVVFSDDCYDLSDDYVMIVREMPEGGNVLTAAGESMVYTCPGDGNADVIEFAVSNNSNSMSQYVVTDANGIILGLPPGNMQDFEGAPAGTCLMWHLSYTGTLTAMAGDDVATVVFSDDCYDLSDDYVMIVRDMPEGGNVLTDAGASMVTTISGDGNPDVISFAVTGNSNSPSQYVVTDVNGIILGLPPGNMQDFEGAPAGTCYVWHLSYTGNLTAMMGDDVAMISFSDDCYDLSDDFVTVVRMASPGQNAVATSVGGTTVSVDIATGQTVVTFTNNATQAFSYQYVIVDPSNEIAALPMANDYDFAQLPLALYQVYGVLFQGNFTAAVGDDLFSAQLSDQWASVSSNSILVDVSSSVGIGELSANQNSFDLYPNPAQGVLNISAAFGMERIQILDLQGRVIRDHVLQSGSETERLSVDGLVSGTYVILISSGNDLHTARFVKH